MYRAVGVLYNASKFSIVKRKQSGRGVWVMLKHVESAQMIWVGSVHLPVNETVEEVDRRTAEFLSALPATSQPCVVMGDLNTQFTWTLREEGGAAQVVRQMEQVEASNGRERVPTGSTTGSRHA